MDLPVKKILLSFPEEFSVKMALQQIPIPTNNCLCLPEDGICREGLFSAQPVQLCSDFAQWKSISVYSIG